MVKFLLIIIMLLTSSHNLLADHSVLVSGSTTVYETFFKETEEQLNSESGLKFVFRNNNSLDGLTDLLTGRAHVAMISAPLELLLKKISPELAAKGKQVHELLLRNVRLLVIVHPSNPVTRITTKQLQQIYLGQVRNWKELGGRDASILPLVPPKGAATRELFQKEILSDQPWGEEVINIRKTSIMAVAVAEITDAVGIVSDIFIKTSHKVSLVESDRSIIRPLTLVTTQPADPAFQALKTFLEHHFGLALPRLQERF
ncbi:MAG: hypothetical protein G8345_14410 [Magnetococcales bacterium]|nr:substrate-binding domain-containing protein [Magnetococcales bacterium]NGZ28068.1 hypothetical protein [Magnetococcales bacterium]